MKGLFHPDSRLMRILITACNLVILNLLWILTSLPIVTMGASNSAMYAVIFQLLDDGSDSVILPYFRAFRANFRQSTLVWIPMALVTAILVIDALYIVNNDVSALLWIPFALVLLVLLAMTSYVFGLIPRFDNELRDILRNSLLIFLMNIFPSLSMILVQAIPLLFFFFLPSFFLRIGILWLGFGVSLFSYVNGSTMLRIFKKYLPKETETADRLN